MLDVKVPSFLPTGSHWSEQLRKAPAVTPPPATGFVAMNPDALRSFVNSTNGRALINRLNSPALALQPLVQLDVEATRHITQALGQLPAPKPKAKRRAPRRVDVPAPAVPAAAPPYEVVVVRSRAARPARVTAPPVGRPTTVQAFTPQQTVTAGTAGGALLGAGVAQLFNSVRHVDPTGIGSVIFAVAGALAGAGAGMLVSAKVVSPTKVVVPGLSVSFKPV